MVNSCGFYILPSYDAVQAAKAACRPAGIVASSANVQAPLQGILDHTLSRILLDKEVADSVTRISHKYNQAVDFELLCKWGLDGSGGHPIFKQASNDDEERVPGNLLTSHLIALQVVAIADNEVTIVYDNVCHNSSISCRPLRYWYTKETKENVKEEIR